MGPSKKDHFTPNTKAVDFFKGKIVITLFFNSDMCVGA
jgi:hypothetical protein